MALGRQPLCAIGEWDRRPFLGAKTVASTRSPVTAIQVDLQAAPARSN